jgi:hypothetical protein
VLVVISDVKAAGAQSARPSYMYPGGVNVSNAISSFSNKLKGQGKEKSEDDDESDTDHKTLLITIILNWTDPGSVWILFSDIPPNDQYIGTKMIDSEILLRNIGRRDLNHFKSLVQKCMRNKEMVRHV